ncbi:MAG: methyltransferase domain-containing protein [Sphingopyxis sp.]|jgi:2-polyprenyl-3-methyl-5-hydroxy-6-metoxy-1,4-benzoquinol methylase|nr:methyltransferase domain-containing protein [Sphingopyxis sp.]
MTQRSITKLAAAANPPPMHGYHDLVRIDVLPHLTGCGGVLLDIGGAGGATALAARQQGLADRVGVFDLIAPTIEKSGLDFSARVDLEDLESVTDLLETHGPFDTILTLDILEHLVDPWRMVELLHRHLKPGGIIVASIPNVQHYSVTWPLLRRGEWELQDIGVLDRTHLRFFVRTTAVRLMTSSGLSLEAVIGRRSGGRLARLIDRLTFGMLSGFFDLQFIVRVRQQH